MIKLVATDIDGTLLIPEGQFTDGVKQCVQKLCQKGIKVVLCTGRPLKGVEKFLDEL